MHTEKKHAETYNLFILRKAGTLRMSKDVSFKNRDRFIQLGIAIAALRKMRGLSQEKLAEAMQRLADLSGHMNRTAFAKPDPGTEVSNLLLALGFSTKLRGYAYLRDAILEQMRNPGCMMTKELYPAVGKSYRANGAQVERSIRSSIEKAWDGRDEQLWNLYFQPDAAGKQRKPSNAVFISGLATRLLLGREKDTE